MVLLVVIEDLGSDVSADVSLKKLKKVCERFEPELPMPVKTVEAGNHLQCVRKCSKDDACVTAKYENGDCSFYQETEVNCTTRMSESETYVEAIFSILHEDFVLALNS